MDDGLPPQLIDPNNILVGWTPGQKAVECAPNYESIVRLGRMRWGITVRQPNGDRTVHELARVTLAH